ncbi:hypothetical protein D3C87_1838260 [compost metagenome]
MPPSSNETGFTPAAATRMMAPPVADSPVKVMASMSGLAVSHSPVEAAPRPWTRLNTPGGTPAASITSASRVAVEGVSSLGLTTTTLPQARAGATFHVISSSGRFHGEMIATTPSGRATA